MRVCLLAGASSIHTIRWVNGLAKAGLVVHLITQHPAIDNIDAAVNVTQYPYRGNPGYFLMAPSVRRRVGQIKPQVLNAHYASGYATTARIVGFHPWLLNVWGSDVYDFPARSPIHRWWLRSNLLAADHVASTSHCMAAQTRTIAPELHDISITPFGVDMAMFSNRSHSLRDKEDEGLIVVGTVKKLAPKYGVDILIRAFASVRRKLLVRDPALAQRLRLRIVGDGPDEKTLLQLTRDLDVEQVAEFTGRVLYEQVPCEMAALDIYVALSRLDSESFGVAILEAGAAKRPVVVSDAGGLPEVVINGKTGIVVPKNNPEAAAEALLKLITNMHLRIEMGEAGYAHVKRNYDWDACVGTMVKLYEQVIAKYESK